MARRFAPQFDVSADGRRFVIIGGGSEDPAHLVVVQDFVDDLKRVMTLP